MSLSLPVLRCGSPPSPRLLQAVAPFGLLVWHKPPSVPRHPAGDVLARIGALPGGSVVLVTGPSGCGKSTLLRSVAFAASESRATVIDASTQLQRAPDDRPVIDIVAGPLMDALRALAASGLAEPMLWARTPRELSDGQRLRLCLALAMARCPAGAGATPEVVLTIDECCSTLDRVTARGVARTLRRWTSSRPYLRVVCATAHSDLTDALEPDLAIALSLEESPHACVDRITSTQT